MNELTQTIPNLIKNAIAFLAIFGVVLEFAPKIKINPLSFLLNTLGKKINQDIYTKVDELTTKVQELDTNSKENHKKQLRIQISNFANDLRYGEKKSEGQFIAIIELCDEYLDNKWNSKVKLDAEFIKREYEKKLGGK